MAPLEDLSIKQCIKCRIKNAAGIKQLNTKLKLQAKNNMYRWLMKNKYPSGFQVLCWNCNMGKQINGGVCPHHE